MADRFACISKTDIDRQPESETTEKPIEISDKVESAPTESDVKRSATAPERQRFSWQLIWREEVEGRLASASKTDVDRQPEATIVEKSIKAPANIETAPSADVAKSSATAPERSFSLSRRPVSVEQGVGYSGASTSRSTTPASFVSGAGS
jgi:hypothetical protein